MTFLCQVSDLWQRHILSVQEPHADLRGQHNRVLNIGVFIFFRHVDWASDQVRFRYTASLEQGPTQVSGAILRIWGMRALPTHVYTTAYCTANDAAFYAHAMNCEQG